MYSTAILSSGLPTGSLTLHQPASSTDAHEITGLRACRHLPENRGEFEYCIKNLEEPYARVVRESELKKA
jgi:hypothetical protein